MISEGEFASEFAAEKLAYFLSGYYFNYLLELLSTVDFILHNNDDLKEWQIMKSQEVFELVILHIDNLATGHLLWLVPVFYNACFEAQIFFWWRVMKGEIAPITLWNPDKHRGAEKKMKGEGYIAYSISENWKRRRQERYCFLPHYNSSELYSICCLLHSYKKFPQFSSSFHYFEHYYLFFISMTIEVIFFICAVSY